MPKLREIDLSKATLNGTYYEHPEIKEGVTYLMLYGDKKHNSWKAATFSKNPHFGAWEFNVGSYFTQFVPYKKGAVHSTIKEMYEIIP